MSSLSASEKSASAKPPVKKEQDAVSSVEAAPSTDTAPSTEAAPSAEAAPSDEAAPQAGAAAEAKADSKPEPKPETKPGAKKATVEKVVERAAEPDVDPDYKYAISVQDVHITYRTIVDPRANTIRHTLTQFGRRGNTGRQVREVKAVRGVSLDVEHGSILGIIGANGAGKSTLMRAMAGILPPTSGQIIVNGRISTLLALGVGFNGQLSGRDNVILGGLAAGLTRKQVNERFKDIADWAELDEFIDMPMKSYSSGMYGRLAFAVSTHLEPDVLLIDEALSTGDAHFRRKSYDKMQELVGQARTIVIVSHGIGAIREMCDDCIWIHKGEIVRHGAPDEVSAEYLEFQGVPPEPKKDDTIDSAAEFDDAMVMEDV